MATGFGDLKPPCEKSCFFCRLFCTRKAVLWQLCAGDLRVCRVVCFRFANLRAAATYSFGDE